MNMYMQILVLFSLLWLYGSEIVLIQFSWLFPSLYDRFSLQKPSRFVVVDPATRFQIIWSFMGTQREEFLSNWPSRPPLLYTNWGIWGEVVCLASLYPFFGLMEMVLVLCFLCFRLLLCFLCFWLAVAPRIYLCVGTLFFLLQVDYR
jgi:hypothetical protein